jgi:hypothetical protein
MLVLLEGCAAYAPKIVVDENGVTNTATTGSSSINVFNRHYQALYEQVYGNPAANSAGTLNTAVTPQQLTAEGAGLAYQFCSSFFKAAGTEQQYLLFTRDLVGVVGTLPIRLSHTRTMGRQKRPVSMHSSPQI